MPTLGLIGSGHIGGTVARLATAAGYDVVLSNSRGPETLQDLVRELGPRARAATPAEAGEAGDLVVVSVPLRAYRSVPAQPLQGKVVIDTNNYYPGRDGNFPKLDSGSARSTGLLQQHLGGAKVVKAFNNINYTQLRALARPKGSAERSALPIGGDDPDAKAATTALLDDLGYDTVDAGSLADSWRQQPGAPVYGVPYLDPDAKNWSEAEPRQADRAAIQAAIEAARRQGGG